METTDLLKKVRRIEIKTRGLSRNIFAGEYHSAFKGRGMAFSEVREYNYGDDMRDIDWNVTARYNKPFVKVSSIDSCVMSTEPKRRGLRLEAHIVLEDVKINNSLITKMFNQYPCNNWRKMHHLPLLRKRALKRKK